MRSNFAWFCSMVALLGNSLLAAEPRKAETHPALAPISAKSENTEFGRRTVTFTNGEPAGILYDVIVDWNTGRPEFGVLKLGDNIHPDAGATVVPWSLFRFGTNNPRPQILATKQQLRGAPRLPKAAAENLRDPAILNEARQYYGARGSADSGLSGTLRGSDSSANSDGASAQYLGAGSRGATWAIYLGGALVLGIIVGRYLVTRRTESHPASTGD